jgi:hypothetical protein
LNSEKQGTSINSCSTIRANVIASISLFELHEQMHGNQVLYFGREQFARPPLAVERHKLATSQTPPFPCSIGKSIGQVP